MDRPSTEVGAFENGELFVECASEDVSPEQLVLARLVVSTNSTSFVSISVTMSLSLSTSHSSSITLEFLGMALV